jgi:hypothetical protein
MSMWGSSLVDMYAECRCMDGGQRLLKKDAILRCGHLEWYDRGSCEIQFQHMQCSQML